MSLSLHMVRCILFCFVALFCFLVIKLTLLTDIMGTKYKGLGHLEQDAATLMRKIDNSIVLCGVSA